MTDTFDDQEPTRHGERASPAATSSRSGPAGWRRRSWRRPPHSPQRPRARTTTRIGSFFATGSSSRWTTPSATSPRQTSWSSAARSSPSGRTSTPAARSSTARGRSSSPGSSTRTGTCGRGSCGIGPDDLLLDYLQSILMGFALRLTPEEVYLGDLIAALSAMNAGVTTVLDWSHINTTPAHSDAVVQALKDSGIRAVWYGPNFFHPDPATNPYPNDIFRLRDQYFSTEDQLLTLALAPAGPQFAGVPFAVTSGTPLDDVQARISVHVGVGADGPGWVKQLSDALAAGRHRGLGDDTTSTRARSPSRSSTSSRTPAASSRLPPRSRCRWGTASRRSRRRSTAASAEPQRGRRDEHADRHVHPDARRLCAAAGLKNEEHLFHFEIPDPGSRSTAKSCDGARRAQARDDRRSRGERPGQEDRDALAGEEADIVVLDATQINVAPFNSATGAVVLAMDTSNVDRCCIAPDSSSSERDAWSAPTSISCCAGRRECTMRSWRETDGRPS